MKLSVGLSIFLVTIPYRIVSLSDKKKKFNFIRNNFWNHFLSYRHCPCYGDRRRQRDCVRISRFRSISGDASSPLLHASSAPLHVSSASLCQPLCKTGARVEGRMIEFQRDSFTQCILFAVAASCVSQMPLSMH